MKQNHQGEIQGRQFNQKLLLIFLVVTGRQRNSCSLYQVRSYKHCCQSNLKENHRYHLSVFKGPTICPITWGSNFKRTRTPGDTSFIFMVTDYSKQSSPHTPPPPHSLSLSLSKTIHFSYLFFIKDLDQERLESNLLWIQVFLHVFLSH